MLKGDMGDVQHFADDVIAQRGVARAFAACCWAKINTSQRAVIS